MNLFGSTASGFCLKDSPIDIDVNFDNKQPYDSLEIINQFLQSNMSDRFHLNEIDMSQQNKIIVKTTRDDLLKCYLSCSHYSYSYRTSALINYYSKLDERFKILAFCFRHLARVSFF